MTPHLRISGALWREIFGANQGPRREKRQASEVTEAVALPQEPIPADVNIVISWCHLEEIETSLSPLRCVWDPLPVCLRS